MKHLCLASALVLTACQTPTPAPSEPALLVADRLTWSEPPTLRATGLESGTDYTLVSERRSFWDENATERSELVYRANADGVIDTSVMVAADAEGGGVYAPIRSMVFLQEETLEDLGEGQMRFRLLDGEGAAVLERTVGIGPAMGRLVETVLGDGFPGAYVMRLSDATMPQPAIVLLGGSEGGDIGSRSLAPSLAAEGYTVLGLPYHSPAWGGSEQQFPSLPRAFANLPVDYLEDAVAELRKRDDVDPDRVSLHGASKGAEFVLLAGSLIPDTSPGGGFCGILADVPTDVVWEGWGANETVSSFSWRGEPLPFVPYKDIGRALDRADPYTLGQAHIDGRRGNPDRVGPARIEVEAIDEPVMLIGGDRDELWPSGEMSRSLAQARDAAGLETETYTYPDGGHRVGGNPLARASLADLEARLENFPAMMDFYARISRRSNCRGQKNQ